MIAFFELWRKRASVRDVDGSPIPWLLNTVTNTARNLHRSSRRYEQLLTQLRNEAREEAELAGPDESGALAAIRGLPPREQDVVVLSILEGYPVGGAAELVDSGA